MFFIFLTSFRVINRTLFSQQIVAEQKFPTLQKISVLVAPDPVAFNTQWRANELEYAFLRTLMGKYRDFREVTEEALEFALQRFALQVTPEQRERLWRPDSTPPPTPRWRLSLLG